MKIFKVAQNNRMYHATYLENLDSIFKHGLDPNYSLKNWESSKNVVCLAPSPEEAESFAETTEIIEFDDDMSYLLDEIVILEIDMNQLNKEQILQDSNIRDDEIPYDGLCFEYHGVIPPSAIKRVK